MRSIHIYPRAESFIKTLPLKHQKQLVAKIDILAVGKEVGAKSLVQFPPLKRIRSGDYRIIYTLTSQALTVVLIGFRKNVYTQLERKYKSL